MTIDNNGLATTTGTAGGVVTITASSGASSATATLTVDYTFSGVDPMMTATVPTNAPTLFTSTTNDTTRSPQLIYPNDGVLFPPNIPASRSISCPGRNNTLFEVTFAGPVVDGQRLHPLHDADRDHTGCIYLLDRGCGRRRHLQRRPGSGDR